MARYRGQMVEDALPITLKRAELIARLEARRVEAEKVDKTNLATHVKAEKAYMREFAKAVKSATTWDYEEAKKNYFDPRMLMPKNDKDRGYRSYPDAPSCPRSEVSVVDRMIAMVNQTTQPAFTLTKNGKWSALYNVVTRDIPSIRGLC